MYRGVQVRIVKKSPYVGQRSLKATNLDPPQLKSPRRSPKLPRISPKSPRISPKSPRTSPKSPGRSPKSPRKSPLLNRARSPMLIRTRSPILSRIRSPIHTRTRSKLTVAEPEDKGTCLFDIYQEKNITGLRMIFNLFDKDGDGFISVNELGTVFSHFGHDVSAQDLQQMFNRVDLNDDGFVSFEEFIEMIRRGLDADGTEEELIDAFKVFDKDSNGLISSESFRVVMTHLGDKLTGDEIDQILKEADVDGEGEVNYEEFAKKMLGKIKTAN